MRQGWYRLRNAFLWLLSHYCSNSGLFFKNLMFILLFLNIWTLAFYCFRRKNAFYLVLNFRVSNHCWAFQSLSYSYFSVTICIWLMRIKFIHSYNRYQLTFWGFKPRPSCSRQSIPSSPNSLYVYISMNNVCNQFLFVFFLIWEQMWQKRAILKSIKQCVLS